MKINNNIKTKNYRLLKFNLINSNFIKYDANKNLNQNIEDFEIRLKQILHLIYEYHSNKKSIYFIDFPKINDIKFLKKFNKNNHKFFSNDMLIRKIKNNNKINASLIVFFNNDIKLLVLNNLLKLNVPIISFSEALLVDKRKLSQLNSTTISDMHTKKTKQFSMCLFYSIFQKLLWFL